jgi:hypothetical protein
MNAREYWQQFAKESGLPEDQVKALDAAFANEKVANAFVPRPEYSRSLNEEQKKYNELVEKNQTYYMTEAQRAAENQRKVDEALGAAQRYRDLYGELDPAQHRPVVSPTDMSKYVSAEDYQKELKRIEGQSLYVIKEAVKASQDHFAKFGEPLDIDALEKYAVERNLPIDRAYKDMIQPRLEEKQNVGFAEKLKAAREEGAREALSRVNVPIDTRPRESTPFQAYIAASKDTARPSALESFTKAYNDGANPAK